MSKAIVRGALCLALISAVAACGKRGTNFGIPVGGSEQNSSSGIPGTTSSDTQEGICKTVAMSIGSANNCQYIARLYVRDDGTRYAAVTHNCDRSGDPSAEVYVGTFDGLTRNDTYTEITFTGPLGASATARRQFRLYIEVNTHALSRSTYNAVLYAPDLSNNKLEGSCKIRPLSPATSAR